MAHRQIGRLIFIVQHRERWIAVRVYGSRRRLARDGQPFELRFALRVFLHFTKPAFCFLDCVLVVVGIGNDAELEAADARDQLLDFLHLFAREMAAFLAGGVVLLNEVLDLLRSDVGILLTDLVDQGGRAAARHGVGPRGILLRGFVEEFLPGSFLLLLVAFDSVLVVVRLDEVGDRRLLPFLRRLRLVNRQLGILLVDAGNELNGSADGDLVLLGLPLLRNLAQQILPDLVFGLRLVFAACGQDDLDAVVAHRANGDVVEVGGVDAPLERRRQLLRAVTLQPLLPVGPLAEFVQVHAIDQVRSAGQIHAQLEAAFALVVLVEGVGHDGDGQKHGDRAENDLPEKSFHDRSECLFQEFTYREPSRRGEGRRSLLTLPAGLFLVLVLFRIHDTDDAAFQDT